MWDGTKKLARDVVVGDVLIGDDGAQRVVEALTSGEDKMYEVTQRYGDAYKVIGKHLLTLETKGEVCDISVDDYLDLPKHRRARGYHRVAATGVKWDHQPVPIDPYILGMWLGDGTSRGDGFASDDPVLIQYWVDWCIANGMEVTHGQPFGYSVRTARQGHRLPVGYGAMAECVGCARHKSPVCASTEELAALVEDHPGNPLYPALLEWRNSLPIREPGLVLGKARAPNILLCLLGACDLIENKHIPSIYLQNSEDVRLRLLAGIVDTNGNLTDGGGHKTESLRISQSVKRLKLCDGIADIARSLGFAVTSKQSHPGPVTFPHGKTYEATDQVKIRIMGDIARVPVLLDRKRSTKHQPYPVSTISVSPVGIGRYNGWTVSGGSARYLLGDGTVTHNCPGCQGIFNWTTGKPVSGVIHNPHYFEYQRRVNNGFVPRQPGDMPCCDDGLPEIEAVELVLRQRGHKFPNVFECWMSVRHVGADTMGLYPAAHDANATDNSQLRVAYLMRKTTKEEMTNQLKMKLKKREKNNDVNQVLDMYVKTITDLFSTYVRGTLDTKKKSLYLQTHAIRSYVNEQLVKVGKRYNNVVPIIGATWRQV